MRVHLRDETQHDLCRTCQHSTIYTDAHGRESKVCSELPSGHGRVLAEIVKCNGYAAKNTMDEWDMKQIAWVIEINPKNREYVGFRPPKTHKE